ncbi:uncharacterized protein LOC105070277 isoform X1 [Camelus bactrianus]|uniref:Uncharacterized protein LOC105070277 isoform X1 n=13 Tax=Camelus bactrianus TaxID=9837 RepID=A0AC58Q4A3_CAMBA
MAPRSRSSWCSLLRLPKKLTEQQRGGGARSPASQLIRPTPLGTRERPLAAPPVSCTRSAGEGPASPAPTGAAPRLPSAPRAPRPPPAAWPRERWDGESGARRGTVQDQGKTEPKEQGAGPGEEAATYLLLLEKKSSKSAVATAAWRSLLSTSLCRGHRSFIIYLTSVCEWADWD